MARPVDLSEFMNTKPGRPGGGPKAVDLSEFINAKGGATAYDKELASARGFAQKHADPGGTLFMQGLTLSQMPAIEGALGDAVERGRELFGAGSGVTPKEAGQISEQVYREQLNKARAEHPIFSPAMETAGGMMTPGVGLAGKVISKIPTTAGRLLGSGVLGGALSGIGAAGEQEGGVKEKITAGESAAPIGFAVGAAGVPFVTAVGKAAGKKLNKLLNYAPADVAQRLAKIGPTATLSEAIKALTTPSGAKKNTIEREAASRLRDADRLEAKAGRLTPERAAEVVRTAKRIGGPEPAAVDAVEENQRAVMRNAVHKMGEGRSASVQRRRELRANLPSAARSRLDKAIPGKETPTQMATRLKEKQSNLAKTNFKPAYEHLFQPDEKLFEIARDDHVLDAIKSERSIARSLSFSNNPEEAEEGERTLRDLRAIENYHSEMDKYNAALEHYPGKKAEYEKKLAAYEAERNKSIPLPRELRGLMSDSVWSQLGPEKQRLVAEKFGVTLPAPPEPPKPPTVYPRPERPQITAGTIDKLRQNIQRDARAAYDRPGSRGRALSAQEKAIDAHLDDVPHLQEARGFHKTLQREIDAAEFQGSIIDQTPADFKDYVEDLTKKAPGAIEGLRAVAKEEMSAALRDPGKTRSYAEHLSNPDAVANLTTLVGEEEAANFVEALGQQIEQVRVSEKIAPDVGSKAFGMGQDEAAMSILSSTLKKSGTVDKIVHLVQEFAGHGSAITHEEAAAIEDLSRGSPERLAMLLKEPAQTPFMKSLRGVLGGQLGKSFFQDDAASYADKIASSPPDALTQATKKMQSAPQ